MLEELRNQSNVQRTETANYRKLDQFRRSVGEDKNIAEGRLQSAWNVVHQSTNQAAIVQDFQSRSIRQMVDAEKQVLDNQFI